MITLNDVKTQIEDANALGRANLTEKGVTVEKTATTYEIMGKIADIVDGDSDSTIDYIESTGEQYIDTGIVIKENYRVIIDFQLTKEYSAVMFGVVDNGMWNVSFQANILNGAFDEAYGFKFSQKTLLERTVAYGHAGRNYINTAYLFGRNWEGNIGCVSMKLFNFTITNEKGEIIQWLIPAIDREGVVCLYDKVTKTFFYNQGTGEFTGNVSEIIELKEEQEKTINITENGTTEVVPDEGKVLSKVTVNVEVQGGTEEIEQLIDESGVLEDTGGSVSEKVEELVKRVSNSYKITSISCEANQNITEFEYDCKGILGLTKAFYNCNKLNTIILSNTEKVLGWGGTFAGSHNITTIETLDMSSADKDVIGNRNYNWIYAPNLKNLKIVPLTIKNSITFVWCSNLTAESIQSIAYGLAYVTTAQTLTLNKVFEDDFEKLPAELRDLITNQKGWTLGFA